MTALGWSGRAPRLRPRGKRARASRPDLVLLESRIVPAHVFTVNSFLDGVVAHPGAGTALTSDGRITLRSAIMEENAEGGGGAVIVPAGSYTLSLSGSSSDGSAGDLSILAPMLIQGAGSGAVTIHGDGSDRIFDIDLSTSQATRNVTIMGVTLTGGRADVGGAIQSTDVNTLELDDVALKGNSSTGNGGGIAVTNTALTLTLNNVLIENNTAGGAGGGIYLDGLTGNINGATVAGNTSGGAGGGLAVFDTQGTHLGGAQITDATFSGNTAGGDGGGIDIGASTIVQVTDSTFSLNQAAIGGGFDAAGAGVGLGNTIVAGNTAGQSPDIIGPVSSQGFNLIGDGTGATGNFMSSDHVGTTSAPIDPLLSSLVVHGGTLPVMIPVPGSLALGTGHAFQTTDERGVSRPASGDDIGAVQAQAFSISTTSSGAHAAGGTAFAPFGVVVKEGGLPLPGAVVTFTAPTSGPSGTFVSTSTVVTDASGVATAPTFTANFTPGSYSVQASASSSLSVNIPLVNTQALIDSLSVTLGPGPYQAGQPFQITVTALTPNGTRDTNYTGTVSFATDAGAFAFLPPPTTFTVSDVGRKTFNVTIDGGGSHTITATDPNGPMGQVTVNVTPAANEFFTFYPQTVTEGQPFAITLEAQDANGNPLPNFVGTVALSSDDPHAVLPDVVFTTSDQGVKQVDGLVLWPPGPHRITATAADGTAGTTGFIDVTDLGPSELQLGTSASSIPEGSTLTLSGSFTDPDPFSTHTLNVTWGDGETTVQPLAAGVFQFQLTHLYLMHTPPGADDDPISVTVTDEAGASTSGSASVFVTDVPPTLPPSGGGAFADAGGPLGQVIPFSAPGEDTYTAVANFGDGTGEQPVPVSGHNLDLNHVYTAEGTYPVTVTVSDDDGGSATLTETAAIFRPGTTGVKVVVVPVNQSETISIPGAIVTLDNLGGTTPAVLLVGLVNPADLAKLSGSPSANSADLVAAYEIRVLTPGPDSILTAQLTYPNGQPAANPTVQYYDLATGTFASVKGSTTIPNSFSVNTTAHTVTFILGNTSTPKVSDMSGTVFTLSIPAPAPSPTTNANNQALSNAAPSPFLLASANPGSAALAALGSAVDTGSAIAAPIPTTGLVSSSTLTVAVSAAEGLVRGGGDETLAGRLVNQQTLSTVIEAAVEISDFLEEAFRMWLDQPAPMEAPAAIVPPPDTLDQVQLREVTADVAAVQKMVPAAPVAFDALAVPPSKDVVVAPAESRPWWLTAAPLRADSPNGDDLIPVEHVPTTSERAGVAVTAVWIGGHALAAVAPEPRLDDDEESTPQPEEQDDE